MVYIVKTPTRLGMVRLFTSENTVGPGSSDSYCSASLFVGAYQAHNREEKADIITNLMSNPNGFILFASTFHTR